jgi:RimJ/RimL family protein N-acetyltransferase
MKEGIETERLVLREMSLDDLDFVAAMLAPPEVMRFWPQVYSRAPLNAPGGRGPFPRRVTIY